MIGFTILFLFSTAVIMVFGSMIFTLYFNYTMRKKAGLITWPQRFANLGKAVGLSFLLSIAFTILLAVLFKDVTMD